MKYLRYEVKAKAVPLHTMAAQGGEEVQLPIIRDLGTRRGVSGQRHAPVALYPRGRIFGTHWIWGWMGLRVGLDTEARGKSFSTFWDEKATEIKIKEPI
jgi:hypothetical protein